MKLTTLTLTLAATVFAAVALAHSGATGVVKERMDAMDAMGHAIKRVAPMFQGELGYDADAVREAAETFRSHAGEAMTRLFPKGSNGKPSEAMDTIWRNWDEFAALAERLGTYAEGLSLAAGNGLVESGGMDAGALMGGGFMTSGETMMGGAAMMGAGSGMAGMMVGHEPMMGVEHLSEMPANVVFEMVSQTCTACHTRFRADK